jgi:hypothetical protein
MSDETMRLPTYTRAVGGTDPHPVSVADLIGRLDAQMDSVVWAAEGRGSLEGAEQFAASVRELVTLAQSLEGRAVERVEMLRSTVLSPEPDGYDAVMDRIHGGTS